MTMKTEVKDHLIEMSSKYLDLVWYARKAPLDDPDYWDGVPEEIKHGAGNSMSRVEEMFPDEIDELKSDHGDWTHGFNSGMLAAIRFVLTAEYDDDPDGGLQGAIEDFPELDT